MRQFARLALVAFALLIAIDVLPAYAQCTPGVTTVSVALPELAYQPGSFKPYYVSVSSDAVPFTAVGSSGPHCRLIGTSARAVDFHPFVNPQDADAVAPLSLVRARFDITLDIRPSEAPPSQRCNYDGLDGDCFHSSQDPTANSDEAARWTAHVRLVSTGTDESVTAYDVTYWVNLSQLHGAAGPITAATPLFDVVTAAAAFSEQEAWDHISGLLPIGWFAEPQNTFNVALVDPQGRRAGRTTSNDIPFTTAVTNGADAAIVVVNPQDGLYHVEITGTPSTPIALVMSRVDFSRGLRYPVVDELSGMTSLPASWAMPTGIHPYPFRMEPPPVDGPSAYDRLTLANLQARKFWINNPSAPQVPQLPTQWQNEYRLARTGHYVIHGQAYIVGELTDKWASRRHREARSGRDPNAFDAEFQWLISEITAVMREVTIRGLADAEAEVDVNDLRDVKKIVYARGYFALAEQYLAAGDSTTAVERYWYAFRDAMALFQ